MPLQQDGSALEFDFDTDGPPDVHCNQQLVLVSFEKDAPHSAYLVGSLLVDFFPDIDGSLQLLLVVEAEPVPHQLDAVGLGQVLMHTS